MSFRTLLGSSSRMFRALVVSLLVLGLSALLLLGTRMEQNAFHEHDLSSEASKSDGDLQILQERLDALANPSSVLRKATALGMQPTSELRFVTPSGRVIGIKLPKGYKLPDVIPGVPGAVVVATPKPAPTSPTPRPSTTPPAKKSAKASSKGLSKASPAPSASPTARQN